MDIHPPEHPIRSPRDFAIHIFTITRGIVIALGLESLLQQGLQWLRYLTDAAALASYGEPPMMREPC